ncbi:MAG: hypothetical protein ACLQQ4_14460 [Bacteroidia bacterium]
MGNKRHIGIGLDICSKNDRKHYVSIAVSDMGLHDIEIVGANEEDGENITEQIIALVESCMNSNHEYDVVYTVCFNSDNIKKSEELANSIQWILALKLGFTYKSGSNDSVSEGKTILETDVIEVFEKTGNGFIKHLPEYLLTIPRPGEYDAAVLAIAAIYFQLGELELLKSLLRIQKLKTLSRELSKGQHPTENATYPMKFLTDNDNFGKMLPGVE